MDKAHDKNPARAFRAFADGRSDLHAEPPAWSPERAAPRTDAVLAIDAETGLPSLTGCAPGAVIGWRRRPGCAELAEGRAAGAPAEMSAGMSVGATTSVPAYDAIRARILAAGETLRSIGGAEELSLLRGGRCTLAQFVPSDAVRSQAPARAISQLEEVLGWLFLLKGPERQVVMAVMSGASYGRIGRQLGGISRQAVQKRFDGAVRHIADRLA